VNSDTKIPRFVPTWRVRVLLENHAKRNGYDLTEVNSGAHNFLAFETGLLPRRVYAYLSEEQTSLSINTLEKIINNIDLDLRWLPPEEGGFADVFDGVPQEIPEPNERQKEIIRKGRQRTVRNKQRRAAAA